MLSSGRKDNKPLMTALALELLALNLRRVPSPSSALERSEYARRDRDITWYLLRGSIWDTWTRWVSCSAIPCTCADYRRPSQPEVGELRQQNRSHTIRGGLQRFREGLDPLDRRVLLLCVPLHLEHAQIPDLLLRYPQILLLSAEVCDTDVILLFLRIYACTILPSWTRGRSPHNFISRDK